jgi:murein DD-endopeptidase MepM/ murein hydrolase activator NlpD
MPAPAPAPVSVVPIPEPQPPDPGDIELAGELTQGGWITGTVPAGIEELRLGDRPAGIAPDRRFFAAFDRDEGGEVELIAILADGATDTRTLQIAPRDWRIEHVDVARRPGRTSEAFRQRREPELEAIWTARSYDTGAQGWRQSFIWPAKGRISGWFGAQRVYRGEPGGFHTGIDIAPGHGEPFVAPADGVVVLAEDDFSLEGRLLIVDHGNGLNSAFLHASRLVVAEGDTVRQGQHLGDIGASGRATGPHLHWGVTWRGARLDPILLTGPMP